LYTAKEAINKSAGCDKYGNTKLEHRDTSNQQVNQIGKFRIELNIGSDEII
jgi:hypothetical protein